MTRPRPSLIVSALIAVVLALAGCTSSKHSHSSTGTPAPAGTATNHTGLPQGVSQVPGPTAVPNNPTARKSVAMTGCVRTADGWSASGTAANSHGSATTYSIAVSFTTAGHTVINHAETKVAVPGNGHKTWKVSATFVAPPDTTCVLRGVATA